MSDNLSNNKILTEVQAIINNFISDKNIDKRQDTQVNPTLMPETSLQMTNGMIIHKFLVEVRAIMDLYVIARDSNWQQNKHVKDNFRNSEAPLREYLKHTYPRLKVKASYGIVNAASVPWITISDPNITKSAQRGLYISFLFSEDMESVYLCIAQGVTDIIAQYGKREATNRLLQKNQLVRDFIKSFDASIVNSDEQSIPSQVQLGSSSKAKDYANSVIIYKKYIKDSPDADPLALTDQHLAADLDQFLYVYEKVTTHMVQQGLTIFDHNIDTVSSPQRNDIVFPSDIKGLVNQFYTDLSQTPYVYDQALVERMFASLLAKRFVILTGLSGSGKTQLALKIAEWFSPLDENNAYYKLIPVGADWHDRTHMFGYMNSITGSYVSTDTLQLIIHAIEHNNQPHFLILDEMNLSHVERYFADFLSAIESGQGITLLPDTNVDGTIFLPDNLFVIGTVNIDETTHHFSPKVLDRANVIEFKMVQADVQRFIQRETLIAFPSYDVHNRRVAESSTIYKSISHTFKGMGNHEKVHDLFLHSEPQNDVSSQIFNVFILEWFNLMQMHNAEFGYRTIKEAQRFFLFYRQINPDTPIDDIIDCIIYQKLLPKLNGSRGKLSQLLVKMLSISKPKYKLSTDKILRMQNQLQDIGFTSFAEA